MSNKNFFFKTNTKMYSTDGVKFKSVGTVVYDNDASTVTFNPGTASAEVITPAVDNLYFDGVLSATGAYTPETLIVKLQTVFPKANNGNGGTVDLTNYYTKTQIDTTKERKVFINVLDYAADKTGATDSSTAFANAIAAAQTSGNVVYVPAGFYIVNSVNIPDNITILGQGAKTIISPSSGGTNKSCFIVSAANYWSLEYLQLQGYNTTAASASVNTITNNNINGVNIQDAYCSGWRIYKCNFVGFNGYGVYASNPNVVSQEDGGTIQGCRFIKNYNGLWLNQQVEYNLIASNIFVFNVIGARNTGGNNKYSNNTFSGDYTGFVLDAGLNPGHGSIIGNDFNHCNTGLQATNVLNGEIISGNSFFACAIVATGCTGLLFTGNNFNPNSGITITSCSGIMMNNLFASNSLSITVTTSPNFSEFNNYTWGGVAYHPFTGTVIDFGGGVVVNPTASQNFTVNGKIVANATAGNGLVVNQNGSTTGLIVQGGTNPLLQIINGANTAMLQNAGSIALLGTSTNIPFAIYVNNSNQLQFNTDGSITVKNGKILYPATNTAAGTTGAQTINKPSGSVNFAAGATSLVVTNSWVATTSHVQCTIETADANKPFVSSVIITAAGSFTINLNTAPAAELKVSFLVRD